MEADGDGATPVPGKIIAGFRMRRSRIRDERGIFAEPTHNI
jgi:hypothetical protein